MDNDHWVISDISGRKFPRSECQLNWKGQMVHRTEYEPRHPQDTIRVRAENPAVKDPRPRPADRYPTITADDL